MLLQPPLHLLRIHSSTLNTAVVFVKGQPRLNNLVIFGQTAADDDLSTALATGTLATGRFASGNSLANQLKLVARMITTAAEVGARRRVLSDRLHRLGVRPHPYRQHWV